jgi:hypothetical protein
LFGPWGHCRKWRYQPLARVHAAPLDSRIKLVEFDRSFHLFSLREFHTVSSYMYVFKSHVWWKPRELNPSRQDSCKESP